MKNSKIIVLGIAAAVIVSFVAGYYVACSYSDVAKELRLYKYYENVEVPSQNEYPVAVDDGFESISIKYTQQVLGKKAEGQELTESEEQLISAYTLKDDGYGYATTRFYEGDGGMHKKAERNWETSDGGKTWNILSEYQSGTGYESMAYVDNVIIKSYLSNVTLEEGYFAISTDRGHRYDVHKSFLEVYPNKDSAYPEVVSTNENDKTVTYKWTDAQTREIIATAEYDLQLNLIRVIE